MEKLQKISDLCATSNYRPHWRKLPLPILALQLLQQRQSDHLTREGHRWSRQQPWSPVQIWWGSLMLAVVCTTAGMRAQDSKMLIMTNKTHYMCYLLIPAVPIHRADICRATWPAARSSSQRRLRTARYETRQAATLQARTSPFGVSSVALNVRGNRWISFVHFTFKDHRGQAAIGDPGRVLVTPPFLNPTRESSTSFSTNTIF